MQRKNSALVLKILLLGLLLALLAYMFHPAVGQLTLTVNGAPVADPLARIAAAPAFIAILLLGVILAGLVIVGVGGLLLVGFVVAGAVLITAALPYFWPVLVVVMLAVGLGSLGGKRD